MKYFMLKFVISGMGGIIKCTSEKGHHILVNFKISWNIPSRNAMLKYLACNIKQLHMYMDAVPIWAQLFGALLSVLRLYY